MLKRKPSKFGKETNFALFGIVYVSMYNIFLPN